MKLHALQADVDGVRERLRPYRQVFIKSEVSET